MADEKVTTVRAHGDHLMVKPIEPLDTIRGIAVAADGKDRPTEGVVVLVGPGRLTEMGVRMPPEDEVGDLVSYPSYAGKEIVDPRGFEPGIYLMIRQDELYLNYGKHTED